MKVKLVMAVLDIVPRSIDWTDKEIHEFCYEIGSAGVDMVRMMYWPLKDYPAPFKKYTEGYDLRQWDKVWWHQLQRVRRIINTWKMGIYFDLFDHCGTKEATRDINPWYNNINNVNGIYDTSPRALGLYKKWVSKVVRDVGLRGWRYNPLGIKVKTAYNWFGLGNELTFKGTERKEWAQLWGYGLAEHLRSLGYKQKLLWSGEEQTAHALRGWISPENDVIPGGSIYGFNDTVIQYHGMDYWINAEGLLKTITRKRWIAFSDDGTNIKSDVEKGICVQGNKYCSASADVVIFTVKKVNTWIQEHPKNARLHHIEQLPRSVSELGSKLSDMWKDADTRFRELEIYRYLGEIFGRDVRRKYPPWMVKRYLG